MTLPVFHAPGARTAVVGQTLELAGDEGRHAATVRRLRVGERLVITDGSGAEVSGVVSTAGRTTLEVTVERTRLHPPPSPRLVAVQALAKGDRGELAVELLTEVGADVIVPWAAARSVAVWRPERVPRSLARWRSTALQASKQARRVWLPDVTEPASTAEVAARLADARLAVVLHEAASAPLSALAMPGEGDVVVVVGPEGGIDDGELAAFEAAGAAVVRLGETVLRTSSAGAVAAGALLSRTARWG